MLSLPKQWSLLAKAAFALLLATTSVRAQEPLAVRIDRLLEAGQTGPFAPVASDAEFLRRVSLDLVGVGPTPAATRAFLDDPAPNKREVLVDRLLADPRHPLHMAEVFDVLLMERRADKHVPHAEWLKYLQASFQQNKPWDQLARELLSSDGTDPALRPAAKFFLDRDAEPHIMTRDVGRIFFGVDLQCAQCHDHPLVEHYAQADYYGLFAFVNRTVLFNDEGQKKMLLGEKAEGDADYKSVFTGDASRSRPRLFGALEIDEPHFRLGDEYTVAPADKVRPVPKYSRRLQLATLATNGANSAFNRNLPNRLWAYLFGRGLVHPVDFHHPHNPPSHPAILDLLTQEFVAGKFEIKPLLRQLVLTQAYQRSFDLPPDPAGRLAVAAQQLPALEAEQPGLKAAVETAKQAQSAAYDETKATRQALDEKDKAYQAAQQAAVAARKPVADAQAALAKTQPQVAAKQAVIAALTEASAKAAEAVKLVPNDAELTQAATIFQNKIAAANTELAALQKTAADQTAAVEAATGKFNAAVDAAEAAYAQYLEAAKPWEAAKSKWHAARSQTLAAESAFRAQEARLKSWQQYAAYGQKVQLAAAAEAAVPAAKQALVAAQQAVEQQAVVLTQRTTALGEATKVMTAATQQFEAAKADHANKQGLAQVVAEAIAKSEAALAKLPNDGELTAVVAKLKARHEPLAADLKTAEQTLATRDAELKNAVSQVAAAQQQVTAAETDLAAKKKGVEEKTAAVAQSEAQLAAARAAVPTAYAELTERWSNEFLARGVKPLTPEQLAWSVMEACGVVDGNRAGADAEIEKTIPKASVEADPAKLAGRQFAVEQLLRERLRSVVVQFIQLYGAAGGQPQDVFFATADQALYVANGGTIRSWLPPSGANLGGRLMPLEDPKTFADELYVAVLARRPGEAEVAEVARYLTGRPNERPAAIQELIWGLLASAEFRFNH